jgi:hypothetical protein
MVRALLLLILLLAAAAPTVASSRAKDRHLTLRAEAGLPASSARGQVRIYSPSGFVGGGAMSLVARRDGEGRWTVSYVRGSPPRESQWRLGPQDGALLEDLLDDPATLIRPAEPLPEDSAEDLCPDMSLTRMEIRWRGRRGSVFKTCNTVDPVASVLGFLLASHD